MYWEQTEAMRVVREISSFKNIKPGVRQRCVLCSNLFSHYSEIIMQNLEGYPGIKVEWHIINNLRYIDIIVLIAENKEE